MKKGEDWHDIVIVDIVFVIVIGGLNALLLLFFIMRRVFSCRHASSCCSVVGLDINIVGGFDALLSLFVVLLCLLLQLRLLPLLHCIFVIVVIVFVIPDVDIVGGFNSSSTLFVPPPCLLPLLRCHCPRCCHRCHHRRCHHCHHCCGCHCHCHCHHHHHCSCRCCCCCPCCCGRCHSSLSLLSSLSSFIFIISADPSSLLSLLLSSLCLADCYICHCPASVTAITDTRCLRHHLMPLFHCSLLHRHCRYLFHRTATSLIAPLPRWLVVALPTCRQSTTRQDI
jgi:hypothetical protein